MNKIKSIKTFVSEPHHEEIVKVYEERDQEGNITLLQQFDTEGNIEAKSEYEFDEKGRVTVERQYSISETPDQTLKIEYNESGKAKQVIVAFADGSFSYKNYSRDEAERTTTIDIVDQDGENEGKEVRKFDDEDRVLVETVYTDSGEIETKAEFEYNEHGDVVENVRLDVEGFETVRFYDYFRDDEARINKIEILNEDEKIIREDTFEYDERGNQTKHIMKDLDRGSIFTDSREYDMNNNEVRFERTMGNRPLEVMETKYRADGMMESQEKTSDEGVLMFRFEYELY